MSEAIGFKLLLFLAKNPTVHQFAQEFDIPLELAYSIQHKHTSLWQEMIKVKPKPEIVYHTIDLGYRAVRLNIPREWDQWCRQSLFALDIGDWQLAWKFIWEGIGAVHWAANKHLYKKPKPKPIGLMKSKYPLINGRVQDFKPRYRWCRGCRNECCYYHS